MSLLSKLRPRKIKGIVFENLYAAENFDFAVKQFQLKIFESNKKSGIYKIDRKMNNGSKCYAVFDGKTLIHESWVFKRKLLTTQLHLKNAFTIGDCYTIDTYRQNGIYTSVLKKILSDYQKKKLIIYTDPQNKKSINAILKAGFIEIFRFEMKRFLGLNINTVRDED